MTSPSKAKGNAYEREIVKAAQAVGLEAKRAWGSNGTALGHTAEVDLVIGDQRIQAKRRARLPKSIHLADDTLCRIVEESELPTFLRIPEGCDAVVCREDRGESLVITRVIAGAAVEPSKALLMRLGNYLTGLLIVLGAKPVNE